MILKSKNRQSGFSLIEMIIALACIAVMLSISIPSYLNFIEKTRVRGTINAVMNIKKAVNDMAEVCNGYPTRSGVTDLNEFLKIIDTVECDPGNSPGSIYPGKYPGTNVYCNTNVSIGTLMGVEAGGGSNPLCRATCEIGDKECTRGRHSITGYFASTEGTDCSPKYGAAPYNGGSPGWNYRLLTQPASPRNNPVAVICAVTEGNRVIDDHTVKTSPLIVTINTGGYYQSRLVQDGTGMFGIDGSLLPNGGCSCGPYCEEVLTGRAGCCGPCGDEDSLGYKF